jgi:hypothetical protein
MMEVASLLAELGSPSGVVVVAMASEPTVVETAK